MSSLSNVVLWPDFFQFPCEKLFSHTDSNLAADAVADQAREISKNTHLSQTINRRVKREKQIIVLSQNLLEQKKSSSLCQK